MRWFGRWGSRPEVARVKPARSDGEKHAWGISLVIHSGILLMLMVLTLPLPARKAILLLSKTSDLDAQRPLEQVHFSDDFRRDVGSSRAAEPTALLEAEEPRMAEPIALADLAEVNVVATERMTPTAKEQVEIPLRGAAGVGVTGVLGAVDRITQEILRSLEQRKTLVVWIFDQSGSLRRQRGDSPAVSPHLCGAGNARKPGERCLCTARGQAALDGRHGIRRVVLVPDP